MTKISYKDLSSGLKVAIVFLWILVAFNGLAFIIGFISAMLK
jgi:hypothetical protein